MRADLKMDRWYCCEWETHLVDSKVMSIFTPRVPSVIEDILRRLVFTEEQRHQKIVDMLVAMDQLNAARFAALATKVDVAHLRDEVIARLDSQDELLNRIYSFLAPGEAVFFELEFTNLTTGETRTFKNGEAATMILPRFSRVAFKVLLWDSEDVATRNAAVLDGPAAVNLTNNAGKLLDLAPDGLSGVIESDAKAGIGLLSIEGDATIGEGVKPLIVTADINIPPGEALVAEVVFEAPVSTVPAPEPTA